MIHVANGHSLTALIEQAGLPGVRAVRADPLHEGPVPGVSRDALRAIRAAEQVFFIADLSFGNVLKGLSSSMPPLIHLEVSETGPAALPHGTARLTREGARVLSGDDDRVRLFGIDRWLGGVHLEGHRLT